METSVFYGKEKVPWQSHSVTPMVEAFQFYGRCYKCGLQGHTIKRCPLVKCRVCRKFAGHATDCCNVLHNSVNRIKIPQPLYKGSGFHLLE